MSRIKSLTKSQTNPWKASWIKTEMLRQILFETVTRKTANVYGRACGSGSDKAMGGLWTRKCDRDDCDDSGDAGTIDIEVDIDVNFLCWAGFDVMATWSGYLEAWLVLAYWKARMLGPSSIIDIPSDFLYKYTIPLSGSMDRSSSYRFMEISSHFSIMLWSLVSLFQILIIPFLRLVFVLLTGQDWC